MLALDIGSDITQNLVQDVVREGICFMLIPRLRGIPVFCDEQIGFFSNDTVIFSYKNNLSRPMSRVTKLVFDILISFLLLVALFAPMLLIAFLVSWMVDPQCLNKSAWVLEAAPSGAISSVR